MKVLGKVAFAPVIASGMIAAGAGAGVAMAAAAPATAHGNAVTPDGTTRTATKSAAMFKSPSNRSTVGFTAKGDKLNCWASQRTSSGATFLHCSDPTAGLTGWIGSSVVS